MSQMKHDKCEVNVILADTIVIYMSSVILYDNLLKYTCTQCNRYSPTFTMKIVHNSTLTIKTDLISETGK